MRQREWVWGRVGEAVVIVASILLAFGVDASWEARQRRADELRLMGNLLAEFEANREALEVTLALHRESADLGVELLEADLETVSQTRARELVRRLFLVRQSLNIGSGVLDTYLSSGDAGLIQHERLRHLLAAWPGVLEESTEDETRFTGLIDTTLMPFVAQRAPIDRVYSYEGAPAYVGVFPDNDEQVDLRRLLTSEGRSLISFRVVLERVVVREQLAMRESMDEIIGLLESELGRS